MNWDLPVSISVNYDDCDHVQDLKGVCQLDGNRVILNGAKKKIGVMGK